MKIDGPIPGANYTSDTKNYPWHRPPEATNLDTAIDLAAKQLLSEEASFGIITMLEMGMDVATMTDMFITSGIGAGKWSVDLGILLAGPVSHILCLMAEGYEIEYDLGLDEQIKPKTSVFYNEIKKKAADTKIVADNIPIEDVKSKAQEMQVGGFMNMGKGNPAATAPTPAPTGEETY